MSFCFGLQLGMSHKRSYANCSRRQSGLQESSQFVAADFCVLQKSSQGADRHRPPGHRHDQCPTGGGVDVDMVAATAAVMLPAPAF
jgi:hypothetical protein